MREAVARLSTALGDSAPAFDDETRLKRGVDGHFRLHKQRIWDFWPTLLRDEWLHSLPGYQKCIECLKSDVVVGPQLDRLVGTSRSASTVEAGNIVASLISTMRDDEGRPAFSCEKFHSEWGEWAEFFVTEQIASKMVAPLPNLAIPAFPLRLAKFVKVSVNCRRDRCGNSKNKFAAKSDTSR